jgi:hypothetical protein
MWLIYVVVGLVVLAAIGTIALGGPWMFIVVPVLIGAGLVGLFWRVLARSIEERKQGDATSGPVPSSTEASRETRHEPRTPSELVDARRTAQ